MAKSLFFYLAGNHTAINHSTTNAPLNITCPTSDTLFVSCLPPVPDFINDNTSNDNEDELWFEAIDGLSDISSSCNTIVIQVRDVPLNNPQTCDDTLLLRRRFTIYDGNPSDPTVAVESCELIYSASIPFYLSRNSFPDETIVNCIEDIPSSYQEFLDNFGFTDLDEGCTSIRSDVDNPNFVPPPEIEYGCGSASEPGNAFVRVQFWIIDECGHTVTTITNFRVIDDVPPVITCPDFLEISASEPNVIEIISTHLETATAQDDCSSNPTIDNNFEPNLIDLNACETVLDIIILAQDDCRNPSDLCTTRIRLNRDNEIVITCPNTLSIQCEDPDNTILVSNWVATASAIDATGIITNVSTDVDIDNLPCDTTISVTFLATDVCGFDAECLSSITISGPTSTSEAPMTQAKLFPNPTNNFFTLTSDDKIEALSIFDVTGHIVLSLQNLNQNTIRVDLERHTQGLHILQYRINGQTQVEKLFIN